MSTTADRKRVAVIGAGLIGQAMHLPHLRLALPAPAPYHGWPLAVTVTLLCASASAYLVGRAVPLPAVASAVIGALAAVAVAAPLQTRTSLRLSPR